MSPERQLCVWLIAGVAAGCGVTLDLDPIPSGPEAGVSVEARDASLADAPVVAPADASFDATVDAARPPPDASLGCARDMHWPADGTCGRVLFADSFDSTAIRTDWVLLRTEFAIVGGHLEALPVPRMLPAGGTFAYGHSANGRGGLAVLDVDGHLGTWTSYRVDWTEHVSSTDEAFPAVLPPGFSLSGCDASAALYFRAQVVTESWNEAPGATYYNFGIRSGAGPGCEAVLGDWSLGGENAYWMPGTGYSTTYVGFAAELLSSSRVPAAPFPPYSGFTGSVNRPHDYAIEVSGRTIDAWVDGTHVATFMDSPSAMMAADGTTRTHEVLTNGGVVFTAAYDEPFWIDDVVVTEIR